MSSPDRNRLENRMSVRSSHRMSMPTNNVVEDEDYDELEAMGIADGFRPSDNMTSMNSVPLHPPTEPIAPPRQPSFTNATPPLRPSSISKPKKGADSFALRHDGAMGTVVPAPQSSMSSAIPNRESVSTEVDVMRAEAPYTGPTQPSHPYHMYPQNARLDRTMSVATTSTIQVPETSYLGPTGPTHPYGMYPQNTIEPEEGPALPQATIPVGFPGMQNNYQRRLGPDGEEAADLIGPDGHTEQLPPYTRYPENNMGAKGMEAMATLAPIAAVASSSADPVGVSIDARHNTGGSTSPTMSGAGGIGLATRDPAFSSREDLSVPNSRHSTRSLMSEGSHHNINMAAAEVSEKRPLKTWQKVAARKICGVVPLWAIILAAVCCFLMGIILGTVLAVLSSSHHNSDNNNDQNQVTGPYGESSMTTTFDADPVNPTPTSLYPLPQGQYSLNFGSPSSSDGSCISDAGDSAAWSCNVPSNSMAMNVFTTNSQNGEQNEMLILASNGSVPGTLTYGAQPPIVSPPRTLELVVDTTNRNRGYAWFFQVAYDKLVIVGETMMSASSSNEKRFTALDFSRKGVVQNGDKPWFCYWNGTLLESFIYLNQTSAYALSQEANAATSNAATSTTSPTQTSAAQSNNGQQRRDTMMTQTSSSPTQTGSATTTTSAQQTQIPTLEPYGKVMKVEERRVPDAQQNVAPYCIQMEVQSDGNVMPYYVNGKTNTISVQESGDSKSKRDAYADIIPEEWLEEQVRRGTPVEERATPVKRQSGATCSCIWYMY